jgi:hypothetical protein
MPFVVRDEVDRETVTPGDPAARGEPVTGEQVDVGRCPFARNAGADEHAVPRASSAGLAGKI